MKKQLNDIIFLKKYSKSGYFVPAISIMLLLLCVFITLIYNTSNLYKSYQENTRRYTSDITTQMALDISSRMQMRHNYLISLADTISVIPDEMITEDIIKEKCKYLELNELVIINPDATTMPANSSMKRIEKYLQDNPSVYNEPKIFITDGEELFFSSPIIYPNGERKLLVGSRSKQLFVRMLKSVDYKDRVTFNIINQDGVLLTPASEPIKVKLNDVLSGKSSNEDTKEVQLMLDNVRGQLPGTVLLKNITDEPVMIGYDSLRINDWVLLALVPADIFDSDTKSYFNTYVVIIAILFCIIAAVLSFVPWYYNRAIDHVNKIMQSDYLTGGDNDLAFREKYLAFFNDDSKQQYAIVYLNVRDFKNFNKRYGVKAGDELIVQTHNIIKDHLHNHELISRHAGDHFYLLLECTDAASLTQRLSTIMRELKNHLRDKCFFGNVQFEQGAYLITDKNQNSRILSDRAKIASTYQTSDDVCRFYDKNLEKQLEREYVIDKSFQKALENHEFQLYIQPKVCPKTNTVQGGEVLVRWQHPTLGLLFPGDFIPLFERNGKICELDFYMFEETCKLMHSWLRDGINMVLSVNLSRNHLESKDLSFLDKLRQYKENYNIPDGQIEIELTESVMLERQDVALVMEMINRIRAMGLLCSIDDFGFGYSSLTILKDLNVNTVKLDRQFFVNESNKSWLIVSQLIELLHKLKITVISEGIENHDQVQKLRSFDCNMIQGYVYAKPLPITEFLRWSCQKVN